MAEGFVEPSGADAVGLSPADTPFGAAIRFLVEVAAWGTITAVMADVYGWIVGIAVLLLLFAVSGTFNAEGDKRTQGVVVPGPVRLGLEVALALGFVGAAGILWGTVGALGALVLVAIAGFAGRRRVAWLLGRCEPDA